MNDSIEEQRELLAAHRRTLAIYLTRLAKLGSANAQPEVFHGIREARDAIRSAKAALRRWGETVDDHPNDEPATNTEPLPVANRPVHSATALPAGQTPPAEASPEPIVSMRQKLRAFTNDEFDEFVQDHFPEVSQALAGGQSRSQKQTYLLDYCARKPEQWQRLIARLRNGPRQSERHD